MLAVSPLLNSGQRALDRCSTPCMRPNKVKLAIICSGTICNLLMRQKRKVAVAIALILSLLSAVTKAAKPPIHHIKRFGLAQSAERYLPCMSQMSCNSNCIHAICATWVQARMGLGVSEGVTVLTWKVQCS